MYSYICQKIISVTMASACSHYQFEIRSLEYYFSLSGIQVRKGTRSAIFRLSMQISNKPAILHFCAQVSGEVILF